MTCWIIIPVKAPPLAKGRLAGALGASERDALTRAMLRRAVGAAQATSYPLPDPPPTGEVARPPYLGRDGAGRSKLAAEAACTLPRADLSAPLLQLRRSPSPSGGELRDGIPCKIALISTSRLGLPETFELLPEPEGGLNAAVTSARAQLAQRDCSRIVTLAADLPLVTAADVAALAALPPGVIGIAPDRHGTGTNALSLPMPSASAFTYSYGPGSFALHKAEAERLGLPVEIIATPGLARDIDDPADLPDAAALLAQLDAAQ